MDLALVITFNINECESGFTMPKIKSNSSALKRFKRTANGFKHKQSFTSHILTKKSTKRKRQLRSMQQVKSCDKPLIVRMLPYA